MRPDSPTFLEHFGIELSDENRRAVFVPPMCGHGYQALTDGAEAIYHVSEPFAPDRERGLRYNDPALAIQWPLPVSVISDKDRSWPLIEAASSQETRSLLKGG
jgi:dTDP-4-dehydrorhamnose 3,5-epimerase